MRVRGAMVSAGLSPTATTTFAGLLLVKRDGRKERYSELEPMRNGAWLLLAAAVEAIAFPAFALIHYVDVNSTNPVAPYTNWGMAATVIQNAVDVSGSGDEVVVTNGVYEAGGAALGG